MGHYYSEMCCQTCGGIPCKCLCKKCGLNPCRCPCSYCGKAWQYEHRCPEFWKAVSEKYHENKRKAGKLKKVKKVKKPARFVGDEPKVLKEVLRDLKSVDDLETHEEICDVLSDNIKILIRGVRELLEYHKK